jgi:hypothetical protein
MIYVLGAILAAQGRIHKATHDTAEVVSDFFEAWVDVPWQSLSTPDPQTLKDHRNAGIPPNQGAVENTPCAGRMDGNFEPPLSSLNFEF